MPERSSVGVSSVVMDYEEGIYLAVEYLNQAARPAGKKIALFGVNRDSGSDMLKRGAFLKCGGAESDIFYNDSGIEKLCADFFARREGYHSAICSCDITSLALKSFLKNKVAIPEELLLIGFADMFEIDRKKSIVNMGITTISVSHEQLGYHSVMLARYLYTLDSSVNVTVKIVPEITVSDTTKGFVAPSGAAARSVAASLSEPGHNEFFSDDVAREINDFVQCVHSMTAQDEELIRLLMQNRNRAQIAEKLYISESTLYERIKLLCKNANQRGTKELVALMEKYL